MSVSKRLEVKKTIILEFSLPGARAQSSTYMTQPQLKTTHEEGWTISVDQDTALETATVFEELARAIRSSVL